MNLSEQEKTDWIAKNEILQKWYRNYLLASNEKQKNHAKEQIQMILNQEPFSAYCLNRNAYITGITRYGLDYITEKCIEDIDRISSAFF